MFRIALKSGCEAQFGSRLFVRTVSTKASKDDPLSILSSITGKTKFEHIPNDSHSLFSFLDDSKTKQKASLRARDFARAMPLPAKISGRTTLIRKSSNFNKSISMFDRLVRANNIRDLWYDQMFYIKPNKRRLNKRIKNKKKRFDAGISNLLSIVKDAVRKGY